jgi:glucose/arabinose dehydrogenase
VRCPGALWVLLAAGCGASQLPTPPVVDQLGLEPVATGLQFPLLVTAPLTDVTRLFIVEKRGVIRVVRNGQLLAAPFLDIRSKVSTGSEQGLLGLSFHPRYNTNGVFVISYTNPLGDTRVSSMRVSADPDVADPTSENVILALQQPFANHNGGHATFGPFGFLFIGLGDGGGAGDPGDRAQDPQALLGKILRYQVDDRGVGTIPPGNPFVGQPGFRWEIWAAGVRNPWRFSFDRLTSDLYLADVGQDRQEEVNVSPGLQGFGRGMNFGWPLMEGLLCFRPATDCAIPQLTLPVLVYGHAEGCSVTGGHVYRGARMPSLHGTYFYADFCGGWVRSFRFAGGQVTERQEWDGLATPQITSFGEDATGELYLVSGTGSVFRIVPR